MANELAPSPYTTIHDYPAVQDALWDKLKERPVGGDNTYLGELCRFLRMVIRDFAHANSINEMDPKCRALGRAIERGGLEFVIALDEFSDHWFDDHRCATICSDMQGSTNSPSMWQTTIRQKALLENERRRKERRKELHRVESSP